MKNSVHFILLIFLTLTGCNYQADYNATINNYASKYANEVAISKKYLSMLEVRDFATIEEKIDPRLKNDQLHSDLGKIAALFPDGNPTDVKLIGLFHNDFLNGTESSSTTTLTYEYNFSGKWLQATVVLQNKKDDIYILGINVIPLSGPLEEITKFTLIGKKPINYIVLAATCIVPIFILFALIVCVKTPVPNKKWLWIVFILFGFPSITLNWMDGSTAINLLSFNLFGAGFSSGGPYAPVMLWFSFPVGAILFLLRRKQWPPVSGAAPIREPAFYGAPRKTFGRRGAA